VTSAPPKPRTLGELRTAGYRSRSVREELCANLLARLNDGKPVFEMTPAPPKVKAKRKAPAKKKPAAKKPAPEADEG